MDDRVDLAVRVAQQILANADGGTKLLAVHKHYPTGLAAFRVGFCFTLGAIGAAGAVASFARLLDWMF